jgi:hypothetical protein
MDKDNENVIDSTPFPVLPILLTTMFRDKLHVIQVYI